MKVDDRCTLVTTIDELTEVRAKQIEIGRRQLALEASADEHMEAVSGDLLALCARERDLMDALRVQLIGITLPEADRAAYDVSERVRYGYRRVVSKGAHGDHVAFVQGVGGAGAPGRFR